MQEPGKKKRPRPRARGKRKLIDPQPDDIKLACFGTWELWRRRSALSADWINYRVFYPKWRPGPRSFQLGSNGQRMAQNMDWHRMHAHIQPLVAKIEAYIVSDAAMVLKESSDAPRSA